MQSVSGWCRVVQSDSGWFCWRCPSSIHSIGESKWSRSQYIRGFRRCCRLSGHIFRFELNGYEIYKKCIHIPRHHKTSSMQKSKKGNLAQSHQMANGNSLNESRFSFTLRCILSFFFWFFFWIFVNRLGITFGHRFSFLPRFTYIFIFGTLDYPSGQSVLKALWGVCLRIAAQMIYKLDKGQKLREVLSWLTFNHPLADTKMKSFDHKH